MKIDDELGGPRWRGRQPVLTDFDLVCAAVAQALPAFTSKTHGLRCVGMDLTGLFPQLPRRSGHDRWLWAALAPPVCFRGFAGRDVETPLSTVAAAPAPVPSSAPRRVLAARIDRLRPLTRVRTCSSSEDETTHWKGIGEMATDATLARLREYMVGPTRFINLLSCYELGIIDKLRECPGLTAAEIAGAVGAKEDAVEQLLSLPVQEEFVTYDEDSGGYALGTLADIAGDDLKRVLALMDLVKVTVLRQGFYLTESVRTGTVVGLKEFYGFEGTLFDAVAEHKDLRESWATAMDSESRIDPWFFSNIDIPPGAQVLDLAGNTGRGAIHTYKLNASPGLRVTTFDLPEKEEECLENFRAHGVAEHCSFIGGDVFESVPQGFDVVLIKNFLALWDKDKVYEIFGAANTALKAGGQVHLLIPLYPENSKDSIDPRCVDFFPAFFLGCAMGQGGGLKVSAYRRLLEQRGFEMGKVTVEDPADMPADSFPIHAIVSATKVAEIDG